MEILTHSPVTLAWMGDAVFSTAVREHILEKGYTRPKDLQRLNAYYCSAKGQAAMLETMENEDFFNDEEMEILRRGKHANVHSVAKNADLKTYLKATALEALIGWMHLYHREERLNQTLKRCLEIGDNL